MATSDYRSRSVTKTDIEQMDNIWAEWDNTPVSQATLNAQNQSPTVLSMVPNRSITKSEAAVVEKVEVEKTPEPESTIKIYEEEAEEAEYVPGLFDKDEEVEQDA